MDKIRIVKKGAEPLACSLTNGRAFHTSDTVVITPEWRPEDWLKTKRGICCQVNNINCNNSCKGCHDSRGFEWVVEALLKSLGAL